MCMKQFHIILFVFVGKYFSRHRFMRDALFDVGIKPNVHSLLSCVLFWWFFFRRRSFLSKEKKNLLKTLQCLAVNFLRHLTSFKSLEEKYINSSHLFHCHINRTPCILFRAKQKIRNRLLCQRAVQSLIYVNIFLQRFRHFLSNHIHHFRFHHIITSIERRERQQWKKRSNLKSCYLIRQTCHVFTLNVLSVCETSAA